MIDELKLVTIPLTTFEMYSTQAQKIVGLEVELAHYKKLADEIISPVIELRALRENKDER